MHAHNQRGWSIALMWRWRRKDSVDPPAIYALVTNSFTLYKIERLLEYGIQFRKSLPGGTITFVGDFPQPDVGWIFVRVCEDKALQVRCSREMWPVPLPDDEILDECCNFPIGLIHDANLARDAIPGNVKQPATIGKPAAPARAKIDPRRQVAHFTTLQGKNIDVASAAIWIAPFT